MASGSCAGPGGRPKSSIVWNNFTYDKIKDKSVCTVKSTDGLIGGKEFKEQYPTVLELILTKNMVELGYQN